MKDRLIAAANRKLLENSDYSYGLYCEDVAEANSWFLCERVPVNSGMELTTRKSLSKLLKREPAMNTPFKASLPAVAARDITPELIYAFHDHPDMVWMRSDYLSMRDYYLMGAAAPEDVARHAFLCHVAGVKAQARLDGWHFFC